MDVVRHEKSMAVLENMLTALNVLCYHLAADSRVQVARLGENIFISAIYLWNKRPTDALKVSQSYRVMSFIFVTMEI